MEKSSADVSNRIRAIIVEQLGVDPAHAVDDASLVDDLQDEFNIELSDDVAEAVITVGDAIYVVTSKTKS
ncbi:acyl carrier protein [Sinorhizobium medicae]|nr:acyl carrier protein [Sinorhizobium medicae]